MNLSKQEFLSVGDSAKYIQDKRKLRKELETELAKFLKRGGEVETLQTGHSGEFSGAKSGLIQIGSVIASSIAESKSKASSPKKAKSDRNKTCYDKQKSKRDLEKIKAYKIREALQIEQRKTFQAWGEKIMQGDMKLLAQTSRVSQTAIRSAFYGMTVLKAENWEIVKKCIANFDFTVNQGRTKKRQPNRENLIERRNERLNYLCDYQANLRLRQITQKHCEVKA